MHLNGIEKYFKTENDEIVDFKQLDKYNDLSPLMFSLIFNKDFKLSEIQFDYLIKNSNLDQMYLYNTFPLKLILIHNVKLSLKTWKYVIENTDIESALLLIKNKEQLNKFKKIKSELLYEEILAKINKKEENRKINKI